MARSCSSWAVIQLLYGTRHNLEVWAASARAGSLPNVVQPENYVTACYKADSNISKSSRSSCRTSTVQVNKCKATGTGAFVGSDDPIPATGITNPGVLPDVPLMSRRVEGRGGEDRTRTFSCSVTFLPDLD